MLTKKRTPSSISQMATHPVASWVAKGLLLSTLGCGLGLAFAYKGENPMQESREAAAAMLKELGQKLQAAMASGGPENAIAVCNVEAPAIAERISAEERITIARVGTRVRNPVLGTPNDWQVDALKQFAQGLTRGEKPADMEFVQAVKAGAGSRMELRYAKPIVMQANCLACHGSPEDISPEVQAKLKALYPDDRAVGYKLGELRGAVVVSRFIGYSNN
jgi:hypothetical protein